MSRIPIVVALALLAPSARADLKFEQTNVKLGEVWSGRPLKHLFSFANVGKLPIAIGRLEADCGCMAPRLDRTNYQPGEGGSFLLEVNTLTQPTGQNDWRVRVNYVEGEVKKFLDLHVVAELKAEIKVDPPKLAIYTNGAIAHDIVVVDRRPRTFHVLQARANSPHVAAAVVLDADGKSWRVKTNVKESLPAGTHELTLSIFTNDPIYRELRVPTTIVKRTKESVVPAPAQVSLIVPKGQAAPTRLVRLQGQGKVVVEKIEVDNPALECVWSAGPGDMATLRVGVDPKRIVDVLRGTVTVHVGGNGKTVKIPVVATVR